MFDKITIEISQAELTQLIREKVKVVYNQEVASVTFDVAEVSHGYGANESLRPEFKCATVRVVPKTRSGDNPGPR